MPRKDEKHLYRRIEVRTWADDKFRALSPIPACGQGLWLYLLTGPHTGPIPGLFRAGRAAMAEDLDWEPAAFDKAFAEAFQQGMVKADWKAKLVWIPNAIRCNPPASPNVVKSWTKYWGLLPECDLKREAFESLRAAVSGLGEAFAKAFDDAFGKALRKSSIKAMGNQEQEQEQEQDKDSNTTSPSPVGNGDPAAVLAASNDPVAADPEADDEGDLPFALTEPADAMTVEKLPSCPVEEIVELYHRYMPRNPPVRVIHKTRRRIMEARWREAAAMTCEPFGYRTKAEGFAAWRAFFEVCNESAFLTNQMPPRAGHENWKADFDFLISEKGFTRALENKYHGEAAA